MLKNDYLVAKIGVDSAENGLSVAALIRDREPSVRAAALDALPPRLVDALLKEVSAARAA